PVCAPLQHDRPVLDAQYSPDGRCVVTICGRIAQLWDSSTGERLGHPLEEERDIGSVEFSRDGDLILTVAGPVAHVWDTHTGERLGSPIRQLNRATFTPDARVITVSKED